MLIVVMMTMMFNGLVCVDSDNSDFTKDSGGGSSCAGAGAGASERYYRDKLIATLQILENKEETIRVQGSSLCVAEGRIAELTRRATELRRELDHKAQELAELRQCAESCRVDKSDVCISTDIKEVEGQRRLVQTLEDNLAVVSDLYRECFYEAAKQEELIDMLRKSYLEVRLMERAKTDKITKLHNIINTQKRSIEQCQDVVLEVESLKSEISSFLNSSNNDSGMWERGSEGPDVGEELADILDQLRQLQHMLTSDCTCGLQEENSSLKERNRTLEDELAQVMQRNKDLDECLRYKLSQQYEKQLKEKERETEEAVNKLAELENTCRQRGEACETLKRQLQQAQVLLEDKTAELVEAQATSAAKDATIRCLQQKLEHSEQLVQEGLNKLSEVSQSRSDMLKSQARICELEHRLKLSTRRCRELEAGCREQQRATSKLQACLDEAQARGARLCDESRRVTAGVRQWMREKKQQTREQRDKIKLQKLKIRELERCARMRQNNDFTSQSETEPSCSVSPCESELYRRRLKHMCASEIISPGVSLACVGREDETASCSKCVSNRQQESESEMASCSRAPVPPTRKKRQQSRNDLNCLTSRPSRVRFEPCSHPDIRWTRLYSRLPRQLSSGHVEYSHPRQASTGPAEYRRPRQVTTDEVLERVEHLHTALVDGQRRWGRHGR
ncbi:cingulin-like protein 1 isoform X1 [Cydia fagiglandana]|uniref:cingulin-like protein 1 isoform X1 n=1 Tax=Cydia fagiglandana TaxID=1458189 RepID=UPI002FEDFBCA